VQEPRLTFRQSQRNQVNQTVDPGGNGIRLVPFGIRQELSRENERRRRFRLENEFSGDEAAWRCLMWPAGAASSEFFEQKPLASLRAQ
jgi:hypothetical protein